MSDNPYVGIVVFLVLPAIFFTGLLLIPVGVYLSKRQIRGGLAEETFDRKTALRRIAWFFGATTLLNILIGTQVTYRAVKHMETPQFCGATCHTMAPELAAYQNSPHSRVECVECHVAPGASRLDQQQNERNSSARRDCAEYLSKTDSFRSGKQSSRTRQRDLRELPLATEVRWCASARIQQICRR